jgi:hypothetical protein
VRDGAFLTGLALAPLGGSLLLDPRSSDPVSLATLLVSKEDDLEIVVVTNAFSPRLDAIVHCPPVCFTRLSRPGGYLFRHGGI